MPISDITRISHAHRKLAWILSEIERLENAHSQKIAMLKKERLALDKFLDGFSCVTKYEFTDFIRHLPEKDYQKLLAFVQELKKADAENSNTTIQENSNIINFRRSNNE
jgi:ribosomal 50S subunit-associated protein YjgA (DUF615 family)